MLKHIPMARFDWERIIARAELPKAAKTIAVFLAIHADPDGSNVHPGESRLADILGDTERYVRAQIELLRDLGLIERVENGKTGVRNDRYQLTTPRGPVKKPLSMRLDPDWRRYEARPEPKKRPRKPKDDETGTGNRLPVGPEPDDEQTGSGLPVAEEPDGALAGNQLPVTSESDGPATGNGLPVGTPQTGNRLPVDNPADRKPASGQEPVDNSATGNRLPTHRKPASDSPETGFRHPYQDQTKTNLGSPQATNSLAELSALVDEVEAEITDDDYNTARALLSALPDFGLACQARAEHELALLGQPGASMRLVIVRAAHIARQSPNGA